MTEKRTASFGPYTLDLRSGEFRKFGVRVKMGEQPFQILAMLLERPGEMVSREELRTRLWPSDTFVDFDHGLNSAVQRLRDCLSDTAEKPQWVETVPRRGYRFVGKVEWANGSANAGAALAGTVAGPAGVVPTEPRRAYRGMPARWLALLAVAALAAAALFMWKIVRERRLAVSRPPQIQSLAVLPLVNLSNDTGQDFFADGMTEELTTDLGHISALRVISRTSAMRYKNTEKPLSEIARELNVDAVVEGTVARSGSHLRVTANLVQASPEENLWAESYDSEVGDVLVLQQQIAKSVAREIQVELTEKEKNLLAAARPVNPEAHDLYLKGLYTMRPTESAESSEKAINYFKQAIEKDPSYAEAYSALSIVYTIWIPGMSRSPTDLMPKAKESALKA